MSYIYDDFTGSSGLSAVKWDRNTVADGKWLQKYTLEPIRSADLYLASAVDYEHMRIDMLENATDVITIYESYSSFTETSGDLFDGSEPGMYITDYDIVKVLNDETESGCQTYWQWVYTAGPAPAEPDPDKGKWQAKGALQPYYTTAQIDEMINEMSGTISDNYLSASSDSVAAGKNISIDYTATPAKIVINTTDDAEFGKLSATDYVSAAEAYAVSISGNNISGDTKTSTIDDLITSAAKGEAASAWINTNGADLILSANAGSAASAWISMYSPNLIISANAGSAASAWIDSNKSNIETASGYAKNWNDNKNALYQSAYSGYAASAWIAGYETIAKYGNNTTSFTGNKLTLSAGDGINFTTASNQLNIINDTVKLVQINTNYTFNQVKAIVDAGNIPYLTRTSDGYVSYFYLNLDGKSGKSNKYFEFTYTDNDTLRAYSVSDSDTWTSKSTTVQGELTPEAPITIDNNDVIYIGKKFGRDFGYRSIALENNVIAWPGGGGSDDRQYNIALIDPDTGDDLHPLPTNVSAGVYRLDIHITVTVGNLPTISFDNREFRIYLCTGNKTYASSSSTFGLLTLPDNVVTGIRATASCSLIVSAPTPSDITLNISNLGGIGSASESLFWGPLTITWEKIGEILY